MPHSILYICKKNSPKFKTLKHYNTPGHAHELTFSCYRRKNYLRDDVACELFLSELERARSEHQFRIWAYVLMPNHVHLLIWPMNSEYAIERIVVQTMIRGIRAYLRLSSHHEENTDNRC
ncbi:MAG: transposase [Chitinispirillaceae bacterium]|nr:transposase [Chitinispirillaceae bacterium]